MIFGARGTFFLGLENTVPHKNGVSAQRPMPPSPDRGSPYDVSEIEGVLEWLLEDEFAQEERADFLVRWAARGETAGEIAALAALLRARALRVELPNSARVIDVCGTGGDGRQTFNVSTAVALALAGAGHAVAKHGNRGLTSKSGGFDVLEKLGVRVPANPDEARAQFERHNICFLFAPNYHPVFARIAPLRKIAAVRGSRTVFNLLGPLLNPASPGRQLLGISQPKLLETYASVLRSLGVAGGMVICGKTADGSPLDELSLTGPTDVAEWCLPEQPPSIHSVTPGALGIKYLVTDSVFVVSSAEESAAVIEEVLKGNDRGPRAELVAVNVAAALKLCSNLTWPEALSDARHILSSGVGWRKVLDLRTT